MQNNDVLNNNKHLRCLHYIAELVEKDRITLDEVLGALPSIISGSLLAITNYHIELEIEKKLYRSEGFRLSGNCYSFSITSEQIETGLLRLYTDEKSAKALFEEDRIFLLYLCERIGKIIQRYRLEDRLLQTRKMLEIKNQLLENKYIALRELLDHIELEKDKKDEDIKINIDTIIKPILSKIKLSNSIEKYYPQLEKALDNLTSKFNSTLQHKYSKLTKKEKKICYYLNNGLTTKEISDLLNLSEQTISKHRANIRKKFDLTNKNINLASFLDTLNYQKIDDID